MCASGQSVSCAIFRENNMDPDRIALDIVAQLICAVTGVAGFIGSNLAERLIKAGHRVRSIDSLSPYYSRKDKLHNISRLRRSENFSFVKADLVACNMNELVRDADSIFHLAAQSGLRSSWALISQSTRRTISLLLRGCWRRLGASSSIYGDSERLPTSEDTIPSPNSPYGVTQLAGEHLCRTYYKNFDLQIVVLRYFTVYGPRRGRERESILRG